MPSTPLSVSLGRSGASSTRRAVMSLALGAGVLLISPAVLAADLVVAQVAPFSGPLAVNGEANYAGAKAVFDQVNAAGGINGSQIRLVREDDHYQPAETIKLVKLVAERDHPVAFINLLGSASVANLIQDKVLDQLAIPAVGVTPGSEVLREPGSPFMFHPQAGDKAQLAAILKNLATLGMSRIAVAYQDIPFGRYGMAYLDEQAPQRNMKVVTKVALPAGAEDAKAAAATLKASGAQTYLMILAPNSGAALVRDLRAAGDHTFIYSLSYVSAQGVVAKAGAEGAQGLAISQTTPNPQAGTTGMTRDFQATMKAFAPKGTELNAMSLSGYIAARLTVEALKRAGGKPEGFLPALRKLKLDMGGYTVDFSGGGNVGSSMVDFAVVDRNGNLKY